MSARGTWCAHAIQVSGSPMNTVQRFIRSRVLLLTAAILIAAMCLSVLVQGQSQAALKGRWMRTRGALRRPGPGQGGLTALMQPEIANGGGGISFDQLAEIRKLSGTSVAAPISLVSRVTQNLEAPRLDAMDYLGYNSGLAGTATTDQAAGATDPAKWPAAESVLSDTPKKYRLTASAVSSDGVSEQVLFKSSAEGRSARPSSSRNRRPAARASGSQPRQGRRASNSPPLPAVPNTTSSTCRCPCLCHRR